MAHVDMVTSLRAVPLFAGMGDKQLKRLAEAMRERTVPEGDEITVEGEGGAGFFVIESGEASVIQGGNEVRTLGPGDSFGEMAVIDSGLRSATVKAKSELHCHGLTPWQFKPLIENNPEIAWAMVQTLVGRLREAENRPG